VLVAIELLQKKVWQCIMAVCKGNKHIKQTQNSKTNEIIQNKEPEHFYNEYPAWRFVNCDQDMWSFSQEHIGDVVWTEIFPRLMSLENQTWSEILLKAKKQNHSIDVSELNKIARDRLATRYIEAESLISLRVTGNHRLYGYMTGRVFNILWYDDDHGDNNTCVCRSYLKHT